MSDFRLVRVATVADAAGIARVRVRGWQAGYRGIIPQDLLDAMSSEADTQRARGWDWDSQKTRHWVCVDDDEVVGWTSVFLPARDAELSDAVGEIVACYALPEVWGTGVGHQMVDAALAWFRAQGCVAIVLWVLEPNERAQRFYLRQGFELDGQRKEESMLSGSGLSSLRMRLRL